MLIQFHFIPGIAIQARLTQTQLADERDNASRASHQRQALLYGVLNNRLRVVPVPRCQSALVWLSKTETTEEVTCGRSNKTQSSACHRGYSDRSPGRFGDAVVVGVLAGRDPLSSRFRGQRRFSRSSRTVAAKSINAEISQVNLAAVGSPTELTEHDHGTMDLYRCTTLLGRALQRGQPSTIAARQKSPRSLTDRCTLAELQVADLRRVAGCSVFTIVEAEWPEPLG